MKKTQWVFISLILLTAMSRWFPHPPNFAPITAMALFAPTIVENKKWAYALPLLALLLSDLVIGLYPEMIFTYTAMLLIVGLGFGLREKLGLGRLALRTAGASAIFFAVSNLGVWWMSGLYPKSWVGLTECFVAAVPFYQYSLTGDFVYVTFLFGSYAWLRNWQPLVVQT